MTVLHRRDPSRLGACREPLMVDPGCVTFAVTQRNRGFNGFRHER